MLRLIIADDERAMRETIKSLMDWHSLGVEVIGLCEDGIEAYNMIIDEEPDIVMTDIRMPGLSGLELVREIEQMDLCTQFIILSGYEEFDYAREAMKYGVKHYLLKPCDEAQMEESIRAVSEECLRNRKQRKEKERLEVMMKNIRQDAMYHMIANGILHDKGIELSDLTEVYSQYFDFRDEAYELRYLYHIDEEGADHVLNRLCHFAEEQAVSEFMYGIYVKNTLLLFCQEQIWKTRFEHFFQDAAECLDTSIVEIKAENQENLIQVLETVIEKTGHYDTIYSVHECKRIPVINSQNTMRQLRDIFQKLDETSEESIRLLKEELTAMAEGTTQPDSLKLLASGMCIHFSNVAAFSPAEAAEFMKQINQTDHLGDLRSLAEDLISEAEQKLCRATHGYGALAEEVMTYVKAHISDPNLTLKKIAEKHLYLNVDYVSRQFQKAAGMKFSQYLMEERVRCAKELLMHEDTGKIQYVAEAVGCGNNSRYFSQLFKKVTGMTPSRWAGQMQGAAR